MERSAQFKAAPHNLVFTQRNQRRLNLDAAFFGPGDDGPIKRLVKLRPAVGIARAVLLYRPNVDALGPQYLSPTDRRRQEMRIAKRNVGDRDFLADMLRRVRDVDFGVGQRRTADQAE